MYRGVLRHDQEVCFVRGMPGQDGLQHMNLGRVFEAPHITLAETTQEAEKCDKVEIGRLRPARRLRAK
jgi:hypothetical protein